MGAAEKRGCREMLLHSAVNWVPRRSQGGAAVKGVSSQGSGGRGRRTARVDADLGQGGHLGQASERPRRIHCKRVLRINPEKAILGQLFHPPEEKAETSLKAVPGGDLSKDPTLQHTRRMNVRVNR